MAEHQQGMCGLTLARAAVISVGGGRAPVELGGVQMQLDDVWVETICPVRVDGSPVGTLVVARMPLVEPLNLDDDALAIPKDERLRAELAIETVARLFAIEHRTRHSISSPVPYVGFDSGTDADLDLLVGKRVDLSVIEAFGPTGSAASGILEDPDVLRRLSDRMDGLALLAEALDHGNALGRYHEFIRLFERAFSRKAGPGLTQFLVPFLTDPECPHGFAKREIHTWVDARPKAAHADHRPTFLLEGDVRPWINRMEEAAYDVLLNKAEWREPSADRRSLWRPVTGSMDASSGVFVTQNAAASLSVQMLDGFHSYPLLLAGPLESVLGTGLWVHSSDAGAVLRRIAEASGEPAEAQ